MATNAQNDSTRTDWVMFLVSTVIMLLMLKFADEWFWLALPFSLTYLVKALRSM